MMPCRAYVREAISGEENRYNRSYLPRHKANRQSNRTNKNRFQAIMQWLSTKIREGLPNKEALRARERQLRETHTSS